MGPLVQRKPYPVTEEMPKAFCDLPLPQVNGGFPGGTSGKEPACQCRRHKEMQVQSLGREDPLKEGMAPTPVFLPGESHGQRSLGSYSPWGHKELDTAEAT